MANTHVPHSRTQDHRVRAGGTDLPIFATAFDTFVAVLVQVGEILPEFLVGLADFVSILERGELGSQVPDSLSMEFVLMGLKYLSVEAIVDRACFKWRGCMRGQTGPDAQKSKNMKVRGLMKHW